MKIKCFFWFLTFIVMQIYTNLGTNNSNNMKIKMPNGEIIEVMMGNGPIAIVTQDFKGGKIIAQEIKNPIVKSTENNAESSNKSEFLKSIFLNKFSFFSYGFTAGYLLSLKKDFCISAFKLGFKTGKTTFEWIYKFIKDRIA